MLKIKIDNKVKEKIKYQNSYFQYMINTLLQ